MASPAHAAPADLEGLIGPETVAPPRRELVPYVPPPPTPTARELEGAREETLEALVRDPRALVRFLEENPAKLSVEGRQPAEVLAFAQTLLRMDQTFLAERLLGQAAAKWPERTDVAASWGRVLISLGRAAAALPALRAAAERAPKDAQIQYLLGRAWIGTEPQTAESRAAAVAAFERALDLDPDYVDPEGVSAADLRAVISRLRGADAAGARAAP